MCGRFTASFEFREIKIEAMARQWLEHAYASVITLAAVLRPWPSKLDLAQNYYYAAVLKLSEQTSYSAICKQPSDASRL